MKYILSLFLFLSSFTIQAQNKADYILEEKIIRFAKSWQWQNSLKYLEVMKDAKKIFVIDKKVNQTLLKQYFTKNALPLLSEELRNNDLQEYMLFNGGNGIVNKMIVLFVKPNDAIQRLEVISWGL